MSFVRKYSLYKDTIHGFTAIGGGPSMAWALIRNKCHELKLQVPTMDKIKFVKELSDEEFKTIMKNGSI